MNNTVSPVGLSFKGNLITKVKGRHNVMEQVSKRFAERTKSIPGTLEIVRGGQDYPGAMIFQLKDNPMIFSVCDYGNLFAQNSKKTTKKQVNDITSRFINIFKVLKAEAQHADTIRSAETNLSRVERDMIANKRFLTALREEGNDKFIKIFENLVKSNEKNINKLNSIIDMATNKYLTTLDKIAQKDKSIEMFAACEREYFTK